VFYYFYFESRPTESELEIMAATSSSGGSGAAGSSSENAVVLSSPEAPRGQSATSQAGGGGGGHQQQSGGSSNVESTIGTGTPTRLGRGNSFRIPLPPAGSPAANSVNNNAISPGSPGGGGHQQPPLGSSYGSNSTTASRLGSFALGFRRNRGASTNRGELTSPAVNPPSPPATSGFPSLQASTSLTDFGVAATSPYFEGGEHHQQQQNPASPSQPSSGRGYFSRRGFGRKNTNTGVGFLSNNNNTGNRTPTSEQPPSVGASLLSQTAVQRSRSSSHPSLPLSLSSSSSQQHHQQPPQTANPTSTTSSSNTQSAQDSAVAAVIASAVPLSAGASVALAAGSSSASSNNSSRRQSGEANRTSTTSSPAMHQRSASQAQPASGPANANATSAATTATTGASTNTNTTTTSSSDAQHIRLVPHLESTRSLHFDPVSRDVAPTVPLRIGRFTDRNPNQPISVIDQNRVAFKSKVVSRTHAEIWYDPAPVAAGTGSANGGGWFIRDLKSSSGTFLNHIRLSGAGMESRPFPIRDGDVLQLGVDYQGGTEEIYRCVKMRIELNRGWQRGANSFK
jgi:pSer/pThr/pTyr-binding forkhead associated (FHA) protein